MNSTTCPECGQPIYDDEALLCHFCGGSLRRRSSGSLGKMRLIIMWGGWAIVLAIVVMMIV